MWHALPLQEIQKRLNTDFEAGLSGAEAESRLKVYGYNLLKRKKKVSPLLIFLSQFWSPLVFLLVFASILSLIMHEIVDFIFIFLVMITNAILGFYQEYKAEKTIEELAKIAAPKVIVIRDGKKKEIDSMYLVPGDIVVLRQGDIVPADLRIIEAEGIKANEAILTGEAYPVIKEDCILPEDTPVYKRRNMLFCGTHVESGRCKAVVVETGRRTYLGKIAKKLEEIKERKLPFFEEVEKLSKNLTLVTVGLIILSFLFLTSLRILDIREAFLLSIALGVAAIPEGLLIASLVSLSLGARRMLKRNVLVRKLAAVHGLGSLDVICTDKTGTITKGILVPEKLFIDLKEINAEEINPDILSHKIFLKVCYLCNELVEVKGELIGSNLELSLFNYSKKYISFKEKVKKRVPFDPRKKYMYVETENEELIKGAPERVIEMCNKILIENEEKEMDEKTKEVLERAFKKFSQEGYYTLGFAYRRKGEKDGVFLGLIGLMDEIREEVPEAIKTCEKAGVEVIIVTGDNKYTATAIAKKIGFKIKGVYEGSLEGKSNEEIIELLKKVNIFSRVTPDDKYRILTCLQSLGKRVGMTGDGVNDCIALKQADVGIAMGSGAAVAKEASDIVILDNNFASIVEGIKEGRTISWNMWKFLNYMLGCNLAEVIFLTFSSFFKKVILGPVQLLWINLVTDGPASICLGGDPPTPALLQKKPKEKIVDQELKTSIAIIGLELASLTLLFYFLSSLFFSPGEAKTLVFLLFVLSEIGRLFTVKKALGESLWNNPYLLLAVLISLLATFLLLIPPLSAKLGLSPPSFLGYQFLVGMFLFLFVTFYLTADFIKRRFRSS